MKTRKGRRYGYKRCASIIYVHYGRRCPYKKMTLDLAMAYEENGLFCEYHVFQKGPHGYSGARI